MTDMSDPGINQATISTAGCIVMTILGAFGQWNQIKKIWSARDADCVSGTMTVIMFTLFSVYLVRGVTEIKIMYLVQGIVRTGLVVPILIGVMRFGAFTATDKVLLVCSLLTLGLMSAFDSIRVAGFTVVLNIGLIGAIHQAWKVRSSNGKVAISYYALMLPSVAFQGWYGWYYDDMALMIPCIGSTVLYSTIIILMLKNKMRLSRHAE